MKIKFYALLLLGFSAFAIDANAQCTITSGPTVTPNGLSISVTGTGTGGAFPVYGYDWGDATSPGTSQTSTHTYAAAGNYHLCMYYFDGTAPSTCLDSNCINITVSATGIVDPTVPTLNIQAVPNPFNSEVNISLTLVESQNVEMMVYDLTGKQIIVLKKGPTAAGTSTISWKPSGISEGIYFLQLKTPDALITKKLVYSGN